MKLFVIEAPGKVATLRKILERAGVAAKVAATKGHVFSFSDNLSELGIDASFDDVGRVLRNQSGVEFMIRMSEDCDEIIIATDADAEGEVIAWDVHELLKPLGKPIFRMRLTGMDDESVAECLADLRPVSKADAVPGRTRALVDRLIGHTFSKEGVGVGRVLCGILGLAKSGDLSPLKVRLTAPATDGGRPWVAEFHVCKRVPEEVARKLVVVDFPALAFASSAGFKGKPMHMGDIMVQASDRLGMKPSETAASLQKMYEAGQMSYPRSGARAVSKSAQKRIARLLRRAALQGDINNIPLKEGDDVHDAPYPLVPVDISKDPRKLGDDQGVQTIVARNLVRISMGGRTESADVGRLKHFLVAQGFSEDVAAFVAELPWTREMGPVAPGQTTWVESGIEERMPEAVLLERMADLGLGRPSTWAKHAETAFDRGLIGDDLQLTAKGREWADVAPPILLDARLSAAIEAACERVRPGLLAATDKEPWSVLAGQIVGALPAALSGEMLNNLEAVNPDARQTAVAELAGLYPSPGITTDAEPGHLPEYRPEE